MQKKIVILLGHPDTEATLSRNLADAYETAAREAGHEIRRFDLSRMQFDPILHKGYKIIQDLEPDLKDFQEALRWGDHFLLVYPNWWCTMPALLKGLFDRMWLPGFCFHFHKRANGSQGMRWDKLMRGKTARVIILSGTSPIFIYLFFGDYTNEIACGILGFAGYDVSLTRVGPTEGASLRRTARWRRKAARLGSMGI